METITIENAAAIADRIHTMLTGATFTRVSVENEHRAFPRIEVVACVTLYPGAACPTGVRYAVYATQVAITICDTHMASSWSTCARADDPTSWLGQPQVQFSDAGFILIQESFAGRRAQRHRLEIHIHPTHHPTTQDCDAESHDGR